ncbi:MAG: hypothetical protein AB7G75_36110 [Candidatus Binatia bacterium]
MTRIEQIVTLYKQGKGQREISRIVGLSQPAVRKHLLKLQLLNPPDNPPPVPVEALDNQPCICSEGEENQQKLRILGGPPHGLMQPEMVSCGMCQGQFLPRGHKQRFCCNCCGARAAGYRPIAPHADGCPLRGDNH